MAQRAVIALGGAPEDRFRDLFERHYREVLRYAVRRVGPDEADDVAEDVFTVAWRRVEEAPPEPDTLWWLYGVARRVVGNHLRAARRRVRLTARLARSESEQDRDVVSDPDVLAAFERLSGRDREILRLIAWEGLQPREIGAVLGCAPSSAAVRSHRARRRLAAELERRGWQR